MNKIKPASHLNDQEYQKLMQIYADHNRSMGLNERNNYAASNIVKVERKEQCFEVHYDNGEWFKYYDNGTWG